MADELVNQCLIKKVLILIDIWGRVEQGTIQTFKKNNTEVLMYV